MYLLRLTIVGIAAAGLMGWRAASEPLDDMQAPRLEGVWEITKVERNGVPSRQQVGAKVIFKGNEVKLDKTGHELFIELG